MLPKFKHFMDEADIGSGEKTPAQIEDEESVKQLRTQQEQAGKETHAMDGGTLLQVTEEQQYIATQENHLPDDDATEPDTTQAAPPDSLPVGATSPKHRRKHSRHSHRHTR